MVYRVTFAVLGAVGLAGAAPKNDVGQSISASLSTTPMSTAAMGTGVSTGSQAPEQSRETAAPDPESISEQVVNMIDKSREEHRRVRRGSEEEEGTNIDDVTPEERKRQEEMPRNEKKRMWEEPLKEDDTPKDEL